MTFWDFANAHPYVMIVLGIVLFFIVDSIGVDVTRAIKAYRDKK